MPGSVTLWSNHPNIRGDQGATMKRSVFILVGAIVFAGLGFLVGSVATNWYSEHFAKSDDDINRSVGIFLVIWPLLATLGGYAGDILCQRSRGLR